MPAAGAAGWAAGAGMAGAGLVFERPPLWADIKRYDAQLAEATPVREGPGRMLGRLESDLAAAAPNPPAFAAPYADRIRRIEQLLAEAAPSGEDLGPAILRFEQAWAISEAFSLPMKRDWQDRIVAALDRIAAGGALERYAAKAGRPLVVFASVAGAGAGGAPAAASSPFLRIKMPPGPPPGWQVSASARVVGLPAASSAILSLESPGRTVVCPADAAGAFRVDVDVNGAAARLRILGVPAAPAPLDGAFLRPIRLE